MLFYTGNDYGPSLPGGASALPMRAKHIHIMAGVKMRGRRETLILDCDHFGRAINGGFAHILVTLAPIFLVILLGYGLRMRLIAKPAFWDGTEKLTYYLLLPALLVSGIAKTELHAIPLSDMALGLAGGTLLTALFARRDHLADHGRKFSALFQGNGQGLPLSDLVLRVLRSARFECKNN